MALPLTGIIKLSDIQAEYGGPSPARLKDYYLNGAYVKQNPQGTIPTAGAIRLRNFLGGAKGIQQVPIFLPATAAAGNFEIHRAGANIDEISIRLTEWEIMLNGNILETWDINSPYARLTILETSTFYPSTGFISSDNDVLRFTGGPTGNYQPNPSLPFASPWVNVQVGQAVLDVYVQVATGEEGAVVPTNWLDFRFEIAYAPDPQAITHAQDFRLDVYGGY